MTNQIKKLVDELHLDKYYGDFIRDDNSYNYIVELYSYKVNINDYDVIYIGNRQLPIRPEDDYTASKYDIAEYWLNGNSDIFTSLHRYDNTSNSIEGNKLGNQKLLNIIKKEIIDTIKPNFNVQIMPKDFDIQEQIGRQIYDWKKQIYKSLKYYSFDDFVKDFIYILKTIKTNTLYWHKYLVQKNRFWFISINANDIEERLNIRFDDDFTDLQKCIVIVMKEWLAMIVNESSINPNYSMHLDKVLYKLENIHFTNPLLFYETKTNFFRHKTAIKILLSTMYAKSTDHDIENVYSKFMNWRRQYQKYINGK